MNFEGLFQRQAKSFSSPGMGWNFPPLKKIREATKSALAWFGRVGDKEGNTLRWYMPTAALVAKSSHSLLCSSSRSNPSGIATNLTRHCRSAISSIASSIRT
ncbi:hypothetical protein Ancab_038817 [Ancistrocladus abbreviatus]